MLPAVLALVYKTGARVDWTLVSILLLVVLGNVVILAGYCGRQRLKMEAYLQVFHESDNSSFLWVTRHSKYLESFELNPYFETQMGNFYKILGLASIILPPAIYSWNANILLLVAGIVFVSIAAFVYWSIIGTYVKAANYEHFIANWLKLKNIESK